MASMSKLHIIAPPAPPSSAENPVVAGLSGLHRFLTQNPSPRSISPPAANKTEHGSKPRNNPVKNGSLDEDAVTEGLRELNRYLSLDEESFTEAACLPTPISRVGHVRRGFSLDVNPTRSFTPPVAEGSSNDEETRLSVEVNSELSWDEEEEAEGYNDEGTRSIASVEIDQNGYFSLDGYTSSGRPSLLGMQKFVSFDEEQHIHSSPGKKRMLQQLRNNYESKDGTKSMENISTQTERSTLREKGSGLKKFLSLDEGNLPGTVTGGIPGLGPVPSAPCPVPPPRTHSSMSRHRQNKSVSRPAEKTSMPGPMEKTSLNGSAERNDKKIPVAKPTDNGPPKYAEPRPPKFMETVAEEDTPALGYPMSGRWDDQFGESGREVRSHLERLRMERQSTYDEYLADSTDSEEEAGEVVGEYDEDKRLDVNYYCSRIKDEVTVVWEFKPIEMKKRFADPLPRIPTRVVVVLDISCSMSESYGPDDSVTKLDKVKMFTKMLIKTLNNEDHLGVVTFGTTAKVAFNVKRMGPDVKEAAIEAVHNIEAGGVTNMGAGIMLAIDQFNSDASKGEAFVSILDTIDENGLSTMSSRRYFDDNIILFTDGMANEGITDVDELISGIRAKIQAIKDESHLESDYNIKIATLGTGGFLPELVYSVGQEFSSDPYYFLEEASNMELNLIKPLLLRQNAVVTNLKIKVTALNGVTFDREQMIDEFEPYLMEDDDPRSETEANCWMYDVPGEMSRHVVCVLKLPPKHKTKLKKKEIIKLNLQYRDINMDKRTLEKTVHYLEVPRKEKVNVERDVAETAKHRARINACMTLNKAAECIYRFDRTSGKEIVQTGANDIREYCEYISNLLTSEESYHSLMGFVEPILANLDHCDRFLGDFAVRWDDGWARIKALCSSISREVPTSGGIYAPGAELFPVPKMTDRMEDMCMFLKELYKSLGLATGTVDNYLDVVKELQAKLHVNDEEEDEKPKKSILFSETKV